MAMTDPPAGIGPKRLVVGANFGVGSFLGQRLTALVLTAYVLLLLIVLLAQRDLSYAGWAGVFAPVWMKVATLIAWLATMYHAWIGVKDIWMDYVKPMWLRLTLQTLTALWLLAAAVWAAQILWSV